jgi:hypothetical protein
MDNKTVSASLLPLASLSQESPSTWAIRLVTCATETTGTRRWLAKALERRASISKASKPSAAAAAIAFAVSRKSPAVVQTAPCKMLTLVETPARAASASSSGSAWAKGWSGGIGARVAKRLFNQHREGLFRQIQGNSSSRSHAEQKPAKWLTRQYSIPLSRAPPSRDADAKILALTPEHRPPVARRDPVADSAFGVDGGM